jgi:hypothetical protein
MVNKELKFNIFFYNTPNQKDRGVIQKFPGISAVQALRYFKKIW